MSKISDVLTGIKARIVSQSDYPDKVWITDDIPATVEINATYIISPKIDEIAKTYVMDGCYTEYDVSIYGIVHVIDCVSIENLGDNVLEALKVAEDIEESCFPLHNRRIGSANIATINVGSDTWVANGVIITPWMMTLHFKDYIE